MPGSVGDGAGVDGVAENLFFVACAMIAGSFTIGAMAERFTRFGFKPMTFVIGAMAIFIVVQVGLVLQLTEYVLLNWIAFGFFGTASIVVYALLPQRFDASLSGRLLTGMNMMVFFLAINNQTLIFSKVSSLHLAMPQVDFQKNLVK